MNFIILISSKFFLKEKNSIDIFLNAEMQSNHISTINKIVLKQFFTPISPYSHLEYVVYFVKFMLIFLFNLCSTVFWTSGSLPSRGQTCVGLKLVWYKRFIRIFEVCQKSKFEKYGKRIDILSTFKKKDKNFLIFWKTHLDPLFLIDSIYLSK